MNDPFSPSLHSWTPSTGQNEFPGIGGTISGPPAVIDQAAAVPVQATAVSTAVSTAKSSLPFNISNLSDLKNIVDRMGGIEGVLSTMGKVQKFMSTMQQMAPMIKLFMGSKASKAAAANASKGVVRKRRTKRSGGGKARSRRPAKRR
ncbi:tyrosine protein kinase [Cohnella boryungensis]|uniref:Tyrosine protein kinase n=1 Tax=Cohnella boryungensis TaxID=768479 RepID=A0ABV8SC88_9BACL